MRRCRSRIFRPSFTKLPLQYWQFRFRHWFTHRFYFIREEVMFYLYQAWPALRPLFRDWDMTHSIRTLWPR